MSSRRMLLFCVFCLSAAVVAGCASTPEPDDAAMKGWESPVETTPMTTPETPGEEMESLRAANRRLMEQVAKLAERADQLENDRRAAPADEAPVIDPAIIEPQPVRVTATLSPAAIRRTARIGTGWLAGIQTPAQVAPVVKGIAEAARGLGRPIDPDHYGAGFAFRFGSWDDSLVDRSARALERFAPNLDPRDYFAVGGAREILDRIEQYKAAGVSKFVLRPMAGDDADFMDQTRRLIDEVLPIAHGD